MNVGQRPINVGGSTGLDYFRPQATKYDALLLIVRSNIIEEIPCAAAFVGVDGVEFVDNTIMYAKKWIIRILQETKEPGFAPCRNVLNKDNRITLRRSQVQIDISIGGAPRRRPFVLKTTSGSLRINRRRRSQAYP